jgi:cellulose synthase/poly-beta-1,6-N-acetylglucosamine synthase-like glycosyltransferase
MDLQKTFELILLLLLGCYGSLIGFFTFGLIRIARSKHKHASHHEVFVSVIIPVRNEASNILRLLEEIREQDFSGQSMEVIVADDYSEDDTMALSFQYATEHPDFVLVLVPSPQPELNATGKKRAIERAVAVAKGEILLFTDADTYRGKEWITSMVAGFDVAGIQMVPGPVYYSQEKNLLQKIQSLEFLGLMGTTAGSAAMGYPVMCNGANLAYRRDAFFQTGGFTDNLRYRSGDDQFMMSQIRKHYGNGALRFNMDMKGAVSTQAEATFTGFLQQRIRWVSKSPGYRDPVVILTGAVTYLTQVFLLTGMLLGFLNSGILYFSMFLWLVKILLEYPMVWLMIRFFGKQTLTKHYFIAQVFQLVYVPVAGLLGMMVPYRWKGRKG